MCGFVGAFARELGQGTGESVFRATRALEHRGPDQQGFATLGTSPDSRFGPRATPRPSAGPSSLIIGFRRLAIQDLTAAGNQPMMSPDGRYAIALNGEIYNFRELRNELTESWQFVSSSDTEVALASLATWGAEGVKRFVGMFALAFVDCVKETVLLARDPMGIKPLYLRQSGSRCCFASQANVLVSEFQAGPPEIDAQRAFEYLRFGVTDHDEGTLFRGVRQVRPGERITLELREKGESAELSPVEPCCDPHVWTYEEATRSLREALLESVELHLRSDVPVGVLLSGGIDSSAIAGAVREVDSQWTHRRVFTFVPDDPDLSEERYADAVCQHTGFAATRASVPTGDLAKDVLELCSQHDFPVGSSSVLAQRRLFQAVAQHETPVVLDGQGADELFGGYRTYLGARIATLILEGHLADAARLLKRCRALPAVTNGFLLSRVVGHLVPRRMQKVVRLLGGEPLVPRWCASRWLKSRSVAPKPLWHRTGRSVLRSQLDAALTRVSLPMLLQWEDRNSMASSIESRVPFLTPKLVALAMSLPEHFLISAEAETKAVLRSASAGLIPESVRQRRDKIGFATPERTWLAPHADWVAGVFREASAHVPVIDWSVASRQAAEMLAGRSPYDFRLWRWLNLALWSRRFDVRYT